MSENLWDNVGAGKKKSTAISEYIVKGGEVVRDGLIYGAGILS